MKAQVTFADWKMTMEAERCSRIKIYTMCALNIVIDQDVVWKEIIDERDSGQIFEIDWNVLLVNMLMVDLQS